jgi:benzoate/toluate 1,2-dioxygenase subunit alpha
MVRRIRNLCLYPNVYLMDQISSQIRQYRPIAVDKTEVRTYCVAPKGESAEARGAAHPAIRGLFQRQRHGDAGRPRGVPRLSDQMSYRGHAARWNDLSRGAKHWIRGPYAVAEAIGLNPL